MMAVFSSPWLSIIVPVLNEASKIKTFLERLQPFRQSGVEIIVVDGGSQDGTAPLAASLADLLVTAPRGRGSQMNHGAARASGKLLLFLHADTALPLDADKLVYAMSSRGYAWGRFDVHIEGNSLLFPLIAWCMNKRSRLTEIATGDQAIFVSHALFTAVGGFPDIPLMEDIVLTSKLRRRSAPACVNASVMTSGRRWEKHGIIATILKMWWLRLRFFFGADPRKLALEYGYVPR